MEPQSTKLDQQTAETLLSELQSTHKELIAALNEVRSINLMQHRYIERLNKDEHTSLNASEEKNIRVRIMKNFGICDMLLRSIEQYDRFIKNIKITHLN